MTSFVGNWLATNRRISPSINPEQEDELIGVSYTPKVRVPHTACVCGGGA